jgi:hypothetical protein
MWNPRLRAVAILLAGAVGLSACAYDDGYGYGGVSVGYGGRGYCDPRWDDCYGYDSYGYGYGGAYDPWYGWWGGYYYPGIGIYIYDQGGRRYRWNDNQRRYWEGRRQNYRGRDWNDQRWQRWDGFRGREDGNWNDRRGSWQNRDSRSSAQPWNERQPTGEQTYRQRQEAAPGTTATTPRQEWRRDGWQGQRGTRGGEGGGRHHRGG